MTEMQDNAHRVDQIHVQDYLKIVYIYMYI